MQRRAMEKGDASAHTLNAAQLGTQIGSKPLVLVLFTDVDEEIDMQAFRHDADAVLRRRGNNKVSKKKKSFFFLADVTLTRSARC
jgi:hypothetical protein